MTVAGDSPGGTARDPWCDNARLVLIVLVCVGHAIEPWISSDPVLRAVYLALYTFHMPAFAWLSGRVASAVLQWRRLGDTALRLLWPYLLLQPAYQAFHHHAFSTPALELGWTRPYWILWFLVSLLCWRLTLPLWARLPQPTLWACLVALLAGVSDAFGYAFSLSRTLVFLPFFVVGWQTRHIQWDGYATPPRRALAALALTALAWAAWQWRAQIDPRWLYGSLGYRALGAREAAGLVTRGVHLVVATTAVVALWLWVPPSAGRWTAWGRRTLYAFVFHGFLLRALSAVGVLAPSATGGRLLPVAAAGGAAVVALALCSAAVERWASPLLVPPRWLRLR